MKNACFFRAFRADECQKDWNFLSHFTIILLTCIYSDQIDKYNRGDDPVLQNTIGTILSQHFVCRNDCDS